MMSKSMSREPFESLDDQSRALHILAGNLWYEKNNLEPNETNPNRGT